MRGFVRDEIMPLETLDLDAAAFERATAPLKKEVKPRGLWAAHLPQELGGGGFGQVNLGLMHEIPDQWASSAPVPAAAATGS
jgi:acyl-CoA dehydrogenase